MLKEVAYRLCNDSQMHIFMQKNQKTLHPDCIPGAINYRPKYILLRPPGTLLVLSPG